MTTLPVYLSTPRAMYDQLHRTLGKDTVLLFRVGDFYRAFWADAHRLAAPVFVVLAGLVIIVLVQLEAEGARQAQLGRGGVA